jgi:hypothetical protein
LFFSDKYTQHYVRILTELFLSARLVQYRLRLDRKRDEEDKEGELPVVARFLRKAALMKYILEHPAVTAKKGLFDQALKANLVGDEKEVFYLQEFLKVKAGELDIDLTELQAQFDKQKNLFNKAVESREATAGKQKKRRTRSCEESMDAEETRQTLEGLADKITLGTLLTKSNRTREGQQEESMDASPTHVALSKAPLTSSISSILDLSKRELQFSFVALPDNFTELYQTYIYKSCELCNKRQAKKDLMLCLLCGSMMCQSKCTQVEGGAKEQLGNLCRHAISEHGGAAVFLNTFNGQYVIYEKTRLFICQGLYMNAFGQFAGEIRDKNIDFSQFVLDKDKLDGLKKDMLDLKISDRIVNLNLVSNKIFLEGIF